jgi:hypothetical protein
VHAQQLNPKIMSLFMINFAKNMEWSNAPKDKFTFGVLGSSLVYDELVKYAQTKKIDHKQIVVIQADIANLDQLKSSQLLFLPKSESKNLTFVKDALKGLSILIVTEKQGLVKQGAGISFILDENDDFKTKFQLSQKEVKSAGISMNSELISLAILMK